MKIIVDAQLRPRLAQLLCDEPGITAVHVRELSVSEDRDIAALALADDAIVFTKDSDFVHLTNRIALRVVHLRLGNCHNDYLCRRVKEDIGRIQMLLANGQRIVELR